MKYLFLLAVCLLLLPTHIEAEAIELEEGFSSMILGTEVKVLEDKNHDLDLAEVRELPTSAFYSWDSEVFHLGYTESAYWLKIDLENPEDFDRSLLVEVVNPYLFEFRFHEVNAQQEVRSDTVGTRFTFNQRRYGVHSAKVPHRNFQFKVSLEAGGHSTCYLHFLPSRSNLNFDLYLWESEYRNTWQQRFEDYVLTSFFLLCIIYLMILGIAIYITKFNYYWYYFLYVLLGALLVFSDLGLSFRYLWGQSPFFQQIALIILANCYVIAGTLFIRQLFTTSSLYPRIDQVLKLVMAIAAIIIPCSVIMPGITDLQFSHILAKAQNILIIATCITFFVLLFVALSRKPRNFSGLFLFGFSLHGISLIFASLQEVNLLPGGLMPAYLMKLGYPMTFYTQVTLMGGILLEMAVVFYIAIRLFRRIYKDNNKMLLDLATQKQQNMDELVLVVEGERKRIARELHDGLGVMLSSIKMRLNVLRDQLDEGPDLELSSIIKDLDTSHQEVRSISHNLMPKSLQKLGFEAAVEEQIHRINSAGIKINYYKNLSLAHASALSQAYLFRIIQELLNNVITHSKASEVNLQFVKHENQLLLTLEDNGIGFDPEQTNRAGIGIQNVQQRVKALGGQMHLDSVPEAGTTVSIEIPMDIVFAK